MFCDCHTASAPNPRHGRCVGSDLCNSPPFLSTEAPFLSPHHSSSSFYEVPCLHFHWECRQRSVNFWAESGIYGQVVMHTHAFSKSMRQCSRHAHSPMCTQIPMPNGAFGKFQRMGGGVAVLCGAAECCVMPCNGAGCCFVLLAAVWCAC